MYEGKFFIMAWDLAIMFPMLEMSGEKFKCIDEILYIYNDDNPLNDFKVNLQLQLNLDKFIRSKEKYNRIFSNTTDNKSFVTFAEIGKRGRIGNQLFQAAATIALATENGATPKLKWFCSYTKKDMSFYFKNKISNDIDFNQIKANYIEPKSLTSFKEIKYFPNINLYGYFQSELYFKKNEDVIRHYFEPSLDTINYLNNKYCNFLNLNTCSIHVRRGDYVNNPFHEVCDLNYFLKAIEKINSMEKIDKFLVFSDDISWCKKNFLQNFEFIDGNLDIQDIFLMSLCKHNIISNSSFSWWGSYLNKNKNKKIIAPNKWFGPKADVINKYIYTDTMIKI
jgi:hypothetical protein